MYNAFRMKYALGVLAAAVVLQGFFVVPALAQSTPSYYTSGQTYFSGPSYQDPAALGYGGYYVPQNPVTPSYSYPYNPYPQPTYGACPQLWSNLSRGMTDSMTSGQVRQLQSFLAGQFGAPHLVVGTFGPQTQQYVARFQQMHGVPATGTVGPLTRAAIVRACGGQGYPLPYPYPAPYPQPYPYPYPQPVPAASITGQVSSSGTLLPGQILTVSWQSTNAPAQSTVVLDLYRTGGTKVGTIAIQSNKSGSFAWTIPTPGAVCTQQYPNALCGTDLRGGSYYIKVSLVPGNGFSNTAAVATAHTQSFSVGQTSTNPTPTFNFALGNAFILNVNQTAAEVQAGLSVTLKSVSGQSAQVTLAYQCPPGLYCAAIYAPTQTYTIAAGNSTSFMGYQVRLNWADYASANLTVTR